MVLQFLQVEKMRVTLFTKTVAKPLQFLDSYKRTYMTLY